MEKSTPRLYGVFVCAQLSDVVCTCVCISLFTPDHYCQLEVWPKQVDGITTAKITDVLTIHMVIRAFSQPKGQMF